MTRIPCRCQRRREEIPEKEIASHDTPASTRSPDWPGRSCLCTTGSIQFDLVEEVPQCLMVPGWRKLLILYLNLT